MAIEAQKGEIMRKRIQDEFTEMQISRQRKYQLRMQRESDARNVDNRPYKAPAV